jgi:ubiquitin-protein ligase E3 C
MWNNNGGGDKSKEKEKLLLIAKQERSRREQERQTLVSSRRIFTFIQMTRQRFRYVREARLDLIKKINDLDLVSNMLYSKGITSFLPPAKTLVEMLQKALISDAHFRIEYSLDKSNSAIDSLSRLFMWISKSFTSQDGPSQISTSCSEIKVLLERALKVATRVITTQLVTVSVTCRHSFFDFIMSLINRLKSNCKASSELSAALSSFLVRDLLYFETVARPLCWLASPEGEGGDSVELASRAVEIAIDLSNYSSTPSTCTRLYQCIWSTLFTIPWLTTRLYNTNAYKKLVKILPPILHASDNLRLSELISPVEYLPRPLPRQRKRRNETENRNILPLSSSLPTLLTTPTLRIGLVSASASAADIAFSASDSAFSSPSGLYAIPEKSFFDSPLAKGIHTLSETKSGSTLNTCGYDDSNSTRSPPPSSAFHFNVYSGVDRSIIESWPSYSYLFGNLISFLSSPSSSSSSSSSSTSTSTAVIADLDYVSAEIATRTLAFIIESFPDTFQWSSSRPYLFINDQPIQMPKKLVDQFRRISSERFARSAASVLVRLNIEGLKNPRLCLQDEDDPEKNNYDENSGLEIDKIRASKAIKSKSTNLDASPSTAGALLRGLWETSKLATSFLQRQLSKSAVVNVQPKARVFETQSATVTAAAAAPFKKSQTAFGVGTAFESDEAIWSFIRLFSNLLSPRPSSSSTSSDADAIIARIPILNALSFTPNLDLIKRLWYFFVERTDLSVFVKTKAYRSCARHDGLFGGLALLSTLMGHSLLIIDDFELYQRNNLLPLREMRHIARLLRDILAHCYGIGVDDWSTSGAKEFLLASPSSFFFRFQAASASALRSLYERHSQRPLGPSDMFVIDVNKVSLCLFTSDSRLLSGNEAIEEAVNRLMAILPWSVPFFVRVERFEKIRVEHRRASQEAQPQVRVSVQRARLFDSVLSALKDVRGDILRRKVNVSFINDEGLLEAGIDAGGLFKELWTQLTALVFDPDFGLFSLTNSEELYPNPSSSFLTGFDDAITFELLGRVLGKALYEGVTVETRFAKFFLHLLSGRSVHLHHLPSLDQELYKSLMFLKTYEGDCKDDLCLYFTSSVEIGTSSNTEGGTDVDLIPNGSNIPVTNSNRLSYIHLLAEYRLSGSIHIQTQAFLAGLRDVIPSQWLVPFSAPELQVLISGAHAGVDINDLKANTLYTNGYSSYDSTIIKFWTLVSSFSEQDKALLLRFATSCSRPPPLGFKQLEPKFTIQRVPIIGKESDAQLPSSSTCFNILKLPDFKSESVMRDKLLTALRSGAGFEMT